MTRALRILTCMGVMVFMGCDQDSIFPKKRGHPFKEVHRRKSAYPYTMGAAERKQLLDRVRTLARGDKYEAVVTLLGPPDKEMPLFSKTILGDDAEGALVSYYIRQLESENFNDASGDQRVGLSFDNDGKLDGVYLTNLPGFASDLKRITVTEFKWDNAAGKPKITIYEPGKKPVPGTRPDLIDALKGFFAERGKKDAEEKGKKSK